MAQILTLAEAGRLGVLRAKFNSLKARGYGEDEMTLALGQALDLIEEIVTRHEGPPGTS